MARRQLVEPGVNRSAILNRDELPEALAHQFLGGAPGHFRIGPVGEHDRPIPPEPADHLELGVENFTQQSGVGHR
jgi:hypothetical protein